MAPRAEPLDSRELAQLRGDSGPVAADERPTVTLVEARDVAHDSEPEDVRRAAWKAHLAERDAVLGDPAQRVDRRGDIPHTVPRRILFAVVEGVEIALHALRIHGELVAGAPVVVRVDHDLHAVGRRAHVAAAEKGADAVGMRIVHPHEHVEIAIVVRDLHRGAEGCRGPAARRELLEGRDRGRAAPDRVVIPAVEDGRRCGAHGDGVHHRARVRTADKNAGGRERLRVQREGREQRDEQRTTERWRERHADPGGMWCYFGGSGSAIVTDTVSW